MFKISPFLSTTLLFLFGVRASFSSPRATADLICHTNHASECYPRTFQPTTYFQRVHDDQDLPAGLHIRVNLETGKKEAKLNNASSDDNTKAMDLAVAVQDNDDSADNEKPPLKYRDQIVLQTDDHGSIRPPLADSGEGASFTFSQDTLKNTSATSDPDVLLPALEILEDLSHDIYWGYSLTKDAGSVYKLIELLRLNVSDTRIKAGAALVFGTAIQNNPAALSAALKHCYNDELPTGPMEAVIMALLHEQLPQLLGRFMYLLSALCQDQKQLQHFMNADGMNILLKLFDAEHAGEDGKDRVRLKVANFVLDHFLQPDIPKALIEEETHKSAMENEVLTELENEDPWILTDVPKGVPIRAQKEDPKTKDKKLVQVLRTWCRLFNSTIGRWSDHESEERASTAMSDLKGAYTALEQKLKEHGSNCS